MVAAAPQRSDSELITLETFLAQPNIDESPAWEFVNGVSHQKPMPGFQHSRLQGRLVGYINLQCEGLDASPELRCTVGGRSLIPDISVLPEADIPVDEAGVVISKGLEFAPSWVIEILSPDQSSLEVTLKILHLLREGTQMGWLIAPEKRVVLVFEPDRLPQEFTAEMTLPAIGGVEPELTVEQMFGWLKT